MNLFKALREAVSKMRRRGKVVLACPKCGDFNIRRLTGLDGWLTPEQYVCEKCGYEGLVVVEFDRDQSTKDE